MNFKIGANISETDSFCSDDEENQAPRSKAGKNKSKQIKFEGGSESSSDNENSNSVSSNTHTNSKGNKDSRVIHINKVSEKDNEETKDEGESWDSSFESSSENTITNSVNSSSITISQDRESSTIEWINRIKKINKELKEKFDKGIQYSDAFISLIMEFKDQTQLIWESDPSK